MILGKKKRSTVNEKEGGSIGDQRKENESLVVALYQSSTTAKMNCRTVLIMKLTDSGNSSMCSICCRSKNDDGQIVSSQSKIITFCGSSPEYPIAANHNSYNKNVSVGADTMFVFAISEFCGGCGGMVT
jgi:hypothetical protein